MGVIGLFRAFASPARMVRAIVATLVVGGYALLTSATPSCAASGAWVTSSHVQARLLTSVAGMGDLGSVPVGLELKLDDDWKTYWRSPGDAGLPPTLSWTGSENLRQTNLLYPKPERLTLLGIQTFGYKHHVVFPIDIKPSTVGQPLDLKLKLDILICADLCIPKTLDLSLTIPAGPATPTPDAQTLAMARAAVPVNERASGITVTSVDEVSDKGKPALQIVAGAREPFVSPDAIAEINPPVALGQPRLAYSDDRRQVTFLIPLSRPLPLGGRLAGRDIVLTVIDGVRALETAPRPIVQGASATQEDRGPSFLSILGIALLGGLILNLMPCVLPVLSLKVIAVVSQGGRAAGKIRAGFLATAAGIIVSFLAIALALVAVKSAGRTVGWGIQFQEPAFIAAMAVLVTIFACHLAGLFEVPLPRFIRDAAAKRQGPDESLLGHFVTGAFATLLATPCSAPFLGTAVGFALAGETTQMLAIFLTLGIGLALPYLTVAAVPHLAAALPRPGRWMLVLKQAMAIPLAGTAIWLSTVLAGQVGTPLALALAAALILIAALLVVRVKLPKAPRRWVFPAVAIIGVLAIVLPGAIVAQGRGHKADADDTIAWTRFDRAQIRSLVAQGKTVFVDVTADWCLTCQANKRLVLSKDAMAQRLNTRSVAMQADWTRPNAEIAAYLASYGRYGIPFNIVYGPASPAGIVLPELLSTTDVSEALDKAAAVKPAPASPPS